MTTPSPAQINTLLLAILSWLERTRPVEGAQVGN